MALKKGDIVPIGDKTYIVVDFVDEDADEADKVSNLKLLNLSTLEFKIDDLEFYIPASRSYSEGLDLGKVLRSIIYGDNV